MAYEFRRVDIRIFDFHLTLDPLLAAGSLKPPVSFLGDAGKYRQQFEGKAIAAGAFRIRPLRKKTRTYHHFWKYYTTVFGELDPWLLMVPFVCEPTKFKLDITPPNGARAFARPATYLFPYGWSTAIEMSVHGKLTPAQLRDFIGKVRSQLDGPFLLDGKPLGLSAVLRKYGEELKNACFTKELAAPDFRRIDRHMIVSLSQFDGDIRYYKPRSSADPVMPAADKAALHEVLLGEHVDPASIAVPDPNSGAKSAFLVTRFAGAGFAITYFDKGILLFVQDKAKLKKYAQAMHCLATNVMLCMMMLRSMQSFCDYPGTKAATPKSLLAQARDSAMQQIVEIRSRYRSAVLETWWKFYKQKTDDGNDGKAKDGKGAGPAVP
jgi:hypothetical protein